MVLAHGFQIVLALLVVLYEIFHPFSSSIFMNWIAVVSQFCCIILFYRFQDFTCQLDWSATSWWEVVPCFLYSAQFPHCLLGYSKPFCCKDISPISVGNLPLTVELHNSLLTVCWQSHLKIYWYSNGHVIPKAVYTQIFWTDLAELTLDV